jgi:hypothetical protein
MFILRDLWPLVRYVLLALACGAITDRNDHTAFTAIFILPVFFKVTVKARCFISSNEIGVEHSILHTCV